MKRYYRKTPSQLLLAQLLMVLVISFVAVSFATAGAISGAAPNFTLKSNSGKNLKLSEFRGQVVMLNFWASWCGPCRQEMPLLDKLYQRYKPLGFTILGINVDEDINEAHKMLRSIPVTFPILFDTENKVSELYKVKAMPSTFLIDRDGNMRFLHKGYLPGYEIEYQKQVKILIRE